MYKYLVFIIVILVSCDSGPKVIESQTSSSSPQKSSGIFDEGERVEASKPLLEGRALHTVKVIDKLPTDKYVYLEVAEQLDTFWIATRKQDVNIGGVYFYRDGLLKTRFESKEYDRVFDTIFLVSNIVPANHGGASPISSQVESGEESSNQRIQPVKKVEGSISIKDLLDRQKELAGTTVQITGTCSKVNPNIMGRNWVHLKDGSADEFDLVVTTNERVMEGESLTMQGVLVLDKDFGAGYRYNLIIEEGKRI